MPFFSREITDITTDDLAELLTEGAVENVRLEFKSQPPGPDDTLKKLSGFANTFGGYLLVGASASSADGRLSSYSGVDPQSNYRQTIIQRCYEGVWPPIEVLVSDEIPAPGTANKVCYVIYVSESLEAPHFLTKRRGAWIRTDEFSQRFATRLATFEEIQHLTNRRRLSVERYENLYNRAVGRFESMILREYSHHRKALGFVGATSSLSICPQFPTRKLIADQGLLEIIRSEEKISPRGVAFPIKNNLITQHESVLVLRPTNGLSLMEANVWGQLMYSSKIEESAAQPRKISGIRLGTFLDHVLVFLKYAQANYHQLGYNGPLLLRMLLKQIQGKPFLTHPSVDPELSPISQIDNLISLDVPTSTARLNVHGAETLASDLLKALFFSLNNPGQDTDIPAIESLLKASW